MAACTHRPGSRATTSTPLALPIFPQSRDIHFAGACVQIASQYHFISSGTVELAAFAIVSVTTKLLIRELAKQYVVKRKVQAIRSMCVIIGMPTMLSESPCSEAKVNTLLAATGSIAMALREIILCLGKRVPLMIEVQNRSKTAKTHPSASELEIVPLEQSFLSNPA
uniref:Uncharacterized protein n=1 Tax=Globisporangium ultimum (strain ATCC 200006 / CBS 805.95 / DAOM BR144) TaxID=431595 RepID=K3WFQ0_GLOUD